MPSVRVDWKLMAQLADKWTDDTSAMLSIAIALVMEKLNAEVVDIDLASSSAIVDKYIIDRAYYINDDNRPMMRVTLIKREGTDAVQDNPAQAAGTADSAAGTEREESPGTV